MQNSVHAAADARASCDAAFVASAHQAAHYGTRPIVGSAGLRRQRRTVA